MDPKFQWYLTFCLLLTIISLSLYTYPRSSPSFTTIKTDCSIQMKKSSTNLRGTDTYELLDVYSKHPVTLQETSWLEEKLLHIGRCNFICMVRSLTKWTAVVLCTNLTAASMTFSYLSAVNNNAISLTPNMSHSCAQHCQICMDICLPSHQNKKMNLEGKHSQDDI